ncbi:MAG: HD domain-containing protein [Acidimicrobiia bacterium]
MAHTRVVDAATSSEPGARSPDVEREEGTGRTVDVVLELLRTLGHIESVNANTGNLLHHSLRTATLAEQDGADDQLVVAALCHDIGSAVRGHDRHGRLSAEIIRPYVRSEISWAVSVHEDFIARHRRAGLRRHARYRHRLRRHYRLARRFVDEWDVAANRDSGDFQPLAHFEPRLRRVLAAPLPRRSRKRRLFELATRRRGGPADDS